MRFYLESIPLPDNVFLLLRDIIKERVGIYYENSKKEIFSNKLSPLLVEKGITSFLDYYYFLKYDPESEKEWENIANALSIQETYFFREVEQIKALANVIIPDLYKEGKQHIKIWSSACATGEEPLSIAMLLDEKGWFERLDIEIYGTDISTKAIERAKLGRYTERSFRNTPREYIEKYFIRDGNMYKIISEIHKRVDWAIANLVNKEEIKRFAQSSIIFCRNVLIYFSEDTIVKLIKNLAEYMENPGYLFTGSAESLLKYTTDFELQIIGGAFVYVKR
ncbi:MAG: protein-glutamate O-methyltransferase CheR [bacterium]|nr:protein-glutamate O-methyltransferase CheR [bacterium]